MSGPEMRQVYAQTVEELWLEAPNDVFALEADLSSAMSTTRLAPIMGPNYVNVGIMEAHMIGVAAGVSLAGGFAFVHSFGQFLARRAMDQIFVSLAYAHLSACLVGSDSGISAEHNGGTHMTFEDLGILRGIPQITCFDVCDPIQFAAILKQARAEGGLTYVRTIRKLAPRELYEPDADFSDCGAKVLKSGQDVTLIACGIEVAEALTAADMLAQRGIRAEVIDAYRIQPLDAEIILNSAAKTSAVVTAENHNVRNGLGSAVAELLAEELPTKMRRVGIRDRFGQVGTSDYLSRDYGLDAATITDRALALLR